MATRGKKKGTTVAKRKTKAVVAGEAMEQMLQDQGAGNETVGQEDMALPFIKVLQALSPQVDKRDPKFIKGAEIGMLFNSVTGEVYGAEVYMVPCAFQKLYNEWIPRKAGGGFVATYDDRQEAHENCQQGNDIVDTANQYMLVLSADGTWQEVIWSATSTQLKTSRKLNTLISMRRLTHPTHGDFSPPRFGQVYLMRTTEEHNDQGHWAGLEVEFDGIVAEVGIKGAQSDVADEDGDGGAHLYNQASAFNRLIGAGQARVDFNKFDGDVQEAEVEEEGSPTF